ncbi:site-specific integrase [Tropicibacter sp. R15_0]|uniref:site-specific integrase n=1 Tax=Tropicibacter sp. R15_0 TaxID=2821101 RepID=UPI001ADCA3DC|nr:site-specific integrase [Tropicibacter sp. R15_0]MBO9464131.1 site-specific integrase [Tropicibacter sp. R15_0]
MATIPRLVTRGRTFYFRASVPQDLWDVAGRKEVKISLRTAERSLALMRCRAISNHVDLVVTEARRMAQGQDTAIDQAIRDYFREALDWGQEFADIFAPEAEVDVEDCIATLETRLALLRRRLAVRDFPSDVQSDATTLVGAIPPDTLTSRFQALQRAQTGLLRAKIEADRLLLAKLHGDYAKTQIADPLFEGVEPSTDGTVPAALQVTPTVQAPSIPAAPPLRDLAKKYEEVLATQNIKEKTLGDLRLSFDLARAVIDFDKPASLLDTNDMKSLRDLIGQIPAHYQKKPETRDLDPVAAVEAGKLLPKMGYETQKKRFDFFKRFVAWMVAEEYLPKVPGADIKLLVKKPPKGKPKRLPYSPEQLHQIFQTPIYTGRSSVARSGVKGDLLMKDGRYWVPVIALFAGMRSGEIIQLLKADIRSEEGIAYFDISKWEDEPEEEIKNLKTGSSYRRVPIHSAILNLGFLDYVADRPGGRLFPDLKLGSDGTYSQPWSKFWSNYGKTWKFRTPLHVFHSFRHNFVDALHDANVTDAIAMQLCGHSDDAAHWGYGKRASIARLKEEIEKVCYPVSIPGADW